jgi:septal ring factor EnvC (AmiA/AmiB activator)
LFEEKSKLIETTVKKISDLEASVTEKDKRIASLEAELQRAKMKFKVEVNKIWQASAETDVDLSTARVKIDDLKDEVNHVRQLNENYRILVANFSPSAIDVIMSW